MDGTIMGLEGQRFVLEERKNGWRKLCKYGTRECHKLAD